MPIDIEGPASSGLKTLIVEDDFTCRHLMQTFAIALRRMLHRGQWRGGFAGFQIASDSGSPYNLICMDILMPGANGTEVVRRLRQLEESRCIVYGRGAKILMTTGVTDRKEVVRSFNHLCDAYLFKPIDTGKLLKELEEFGLLE